LRIIGQIGIQFGFSSKFITATKDNLTLHGTLACFLIVETAVWIKIKNHRQITPVKINELLSERNDKPNFIDLIDAFTRHQAQYRGGKWDDASSVFQIALKIKHDDFASTMYIKNVKI
jgi:hypothetical protein